VKTGTAVVILGTGVLGLVAFVVLSKPAAPAPQRNANAPGGGTSAGWYGVASSLINLGTTALKTYGGGSSKPTTPSEVDSSFLGDIPAASPLGN
jgi:hypothetical protein